LDPHLKVGAEVVNSTLPLKRRAKAALRAGRFYATWYPKMWLPLGAGAPAEHLPKKLRGDLNEIAGWSHRLARSLFHSMARNGPKLEKRQILLGHLVDIGAELFVWSCALSYAGLKLAEANLSSAESEKLTRMMAYFGDLTRSRLRNHFAALNNGLDLASYRVSRDMLA
jgi:hypothetical protein